MNDIQLTYSPYCLKLKKPLITAGTEIKKRDGFILKLSDSDGTEGIGDTCPFPEFGSESYADVENALSDFKMKIKINDFDIKGSIDDCLKDFTKLPSLRHGLEQVIINLLCNQKKKTLTDLLNLKLNKHIEVNAVIGFSNADESSKSAMDFVTKGFNTIKVKLGRENFEEDISVIKLIRKTIGDNVNLRIDSNGTWNLEEAINILKKLEQFNIEYAEQPVNGLKDYIDLKNKSKIPLAPDESIRSFDEAKKFISSGAVSYLILKPMLLGGILPTLKIIEQSEAENITPVITSSFESAIGRSNAIIASACVNKAVAHGLGVAEYFKNDLIKDPFPIKSGKIILN
jgi:o-succinylbenzoate synthase